MPSASLAERRSAANGAFSGAALFVALIITFSIVGDGDQPARVRLVIGVFGALSHLALLPVVAALPAPAWAQACGYMWIGIDVMLNVAAINGADAGVVTALRLGGHVPAALWIAVAARGPGGAVGVVGVVLGALLMGHAFVSQWLPPWVLFIPFVLIPVWLVLVGRWLSRTPADRPA